MQDKDKELLTATQELEKNVYNCRFKFKPSIFDILIRNINSINKQIKKVIQ